MRLACFFVPLFPLAARLRSEPDLCEQAVVIVEGNGSAAHVAVASRRARKLGIGGGMSLPQARAIAPKVIARGRDAECERAAREALAEVAEKFSPRIEDAEAGVVFVDITGLERHFRGEEGGSHERQLALAALAAMRSESLPGQVGIASSKLAARVAAEQTRSPVIVGDGEEPAFLAPLPLARLSADADAVSTLQKWGITSIGELARLPEGEVATRLGEAGRALHWAARGIDPTPLIPRQPPPLFREGSDLEWPIVSIEPFLFVANAALDRIVRRMENHGYSCRRLELVLRLEPDGFDTRSIELPAPTRDVKTMLALVRLDLEERQPGGAIGGFHLIAWPDRPRRGQLSLFGPPAMSPDRLAATVARIASIVGRERIGSPRTVDGHAPERHATAAYDPPAPPEIRRAPRRSRGILAVRVLRPAVRLEVVGDDREPRSIRSVDREPKSRPAIEGAVRVASGPWTLEESWWCDTPTKREYWDVELTTGGVYRVYRELADGGWFADGMYD
jgi:protein ImuB